MRFEKPIKAIRFILVVWGEDYIDTLCSTCIPSLLADGNIPYFAAHFPCKFHFVTDFAGRNRLEQEEAIRRLSVYGDIYYSVAEIEQDHKYENMTKLQNLGVKAAFDCGDALGFLFVDGLWATGSFKEFVPALQAGKRVVGSWNMRTNRPDILAEIDRGGYKKEGVLTIAPRDLAKLTIQHLHDRMLARFWKAEPSEEHCGQLYLRLSASEILIRTYLIVPYIIIPEKPALIPPTPPIAGITNTYMDVYLSLTVTDLDDIYICQDSDTHLNIELSPPEGKPLVRRANVLRDYVLWAEKAICKQNLDFFDAKIKLHTDDWRADISKEPTEELASAIRDELEISAFALLCSDWRRLFRRAMFSEGKDPYVREIPLFPDRLLLKAVFLIFGPPAHYRSSIPDGGIMVLVKSLMRQGREKRQPS